MNADEELIECSPRERHHHVVDSRIVGDWRRGLHLAVAQVLSLKRISFVPTRPIDRVREPNLDVVTVELYGHRHQKACGVGRSNHGHA